jgi:FMN phosphatase YigB (HAD superfamily)
VRDRYVVFAFGTLASRAGSSPAGEPGAPRNDGWAGAVSDALRASGVGVAAAPEELRPQLDGAFPWDRPDEMHPDWPGEAWWRQHDDAFADAVNAVGVPRRRADTVARGIREAYLNSDAWAAFDGAAPTLDALAEEDWQAIVYANGPPELDRLLETVGLADHVVDAFTSATTGYELPHPRAFETVEAAVGDARLWLASDEPAHVRGAREVGVPGVLVGEERSDADGVARSVSSLSALVDVIAG